MNLINPIVTAIKKKDEKGVTTVEYAVMLVLVAIAVLAFGGTVAAYASGPEGSVSLPVRELMGRNVRWQFVLVYTMPDDAKRAAVAAVSAAIADGALRVGEDAGLPLHHYPLEETAAAHDAVENGAVGKVLIKVS